ncbi:flavocytochrome c [Erysipelotrichaceae bacterium]|nr:flavocytochrome c [Erysipelotrichaceae bacterium]
MKKSGSKVISLICIFGFILAGCNIEIVATYDTIILGSGISSLVAAADLADSGRRVMIVEQRGIAGGNKRLLTDGISILDESADSYESFERDILQSNPGTISNFFMHRIITESALIPAWFDNQGITLDQKIRMPGNTTSRTLTTGLGEHTGKHIITLMEHKLREKGVEIHYNTQISEIEAKDGLYQLTILSPNTEVIINTRTLVLGEDNDKLYDTSIPLENEASLDKFHEKTVIPTSNGMELLNTLGADFSVSGEVTYVDTYNLTSAQPISAVMRTYGAMLINKEGNRFVDEMQNIETVSKEIIKQTDQVAYLVFDDILDEQLNFLREDYPNGIRESSPAPSDLATKIGVPEEALYKTISEYSAIVKNKKDPDFNKVFSDEAITIAFSKGWRSNTVYSAIQVQPSLHVRQSYAAVSDKLEVLQRGIPLKGIYAIGDSAAGIQPAKMLPGTEYTYGIVMGRIVSNSINTYIEKI